MLTQSPTKTLSLEEYRNLETSAETKHEYHDGEIIEMTGGSINHNRLVRNLIRLLDNALRKTIYGYYRSIPQLNQYLLVSQGEILIESYSKTSENHWLLQEYTPARGIISLDSLGISLNLADIYEGIDFNLNS
ncbi:MAG: Uma2 family endonuclease [Microcystis aeruginosa BS11-05]|nr:Uma2 family endonuclease [Microcystis aeruginosa BS11-05]